MKNSRNLKLAWLQVLFVATTALTNAQENTLLIQKANFFPEGLAIDAKTKTFYSGAMFTGTLVASSQDGATFSEINLDKHDLPEMALGMRFYKDKLYVASGPKGKVLAYDMKNKTKVGEWYVDSKLSEEQVFINDIIVTAPNVAFVTDSFRPVLYSFDPKNPGEQFQEWLNFENSPIQYVEGYNLNGIAITTDKRFLLVMQTNTGKLFRISLKTKEIVEVTVSGVSLKNGDGLTLQGNALYVPINVEGQLIRVSLNSDFSQGEAGILKSGLHFPTAVVSTKEKIYVLNSHLNESSDTAKVSSFEIDVIEID